MTERDPLLALRGLIDEPIAPRAAFADELRTRLLTELASHRPPAIDEDRMMEITTPGLNLVVPHPRERRLPHWRTIARFTAALLVLFGVIAAFASEHAGGPETPKPTLEANLGIFPPSSATPDPSDVNGVEQDLGVLWKITDTDADVPLVDVATFLGTTYFLKRDEILAVDSATGTIEWRTGVPRGWGLLADAQGIYVTTSAGADDPSSNLLKLNVQTGQEEWSVPVGPYPGKPLLSAGVIYVWNTANTLYAISASSGVEIWHRDYSLTAMDQASVQAYSDAVGRLPVAVLAGDSLVVGTSDARVGSIDLGSGDHDWRWTAQVDSAVPTGFEIAIAGNAVAATAITSRGSLVAGTLLESALTAWDLEDGTELWTGDEGNSYVGLVSTGSAFAVAETPNPDAVSPTADDSIFDPGPAYTTVALNPQTGAHLWSTEAVTPITMSADGSMVIVWTSNAWTGAIDARTGAILGSAYPSGLLGRVLATDGSALYGQRWDGALIAIELDALKNGKLDGAPIATPEVAPSPESGSSVLWQSAWNGPNDEIPATFALANGAIYRFQHDGDALGVEAIDAASGETLWWSPAEGDGIAADANGVYITGSGAAADGGTATGEDGPATVIALDPKTGNELWSLATGISESEPVVNDGVLYIRQSMTDKADSSAFTEDITATDTSSGEVLWDTSIEAPSVDLTSDLPLPQHSMVVGDDMIAIVASRGEIIGLRRSDGARIWAQAGFPANATDLGLSGDTLIASSYFYNNGAPKAFPEITTQSAVVAIDIADGTPLWSQDLGDLPTNLAVAQGYAILRIDADLLPKPDFAVATPVGAVSENDWAIVGFNVETGEREVIGSSGGGDGRGPDLAAIDDGQYVLALDNNYSASFSVMEPTSGNGRPGHILLGQPIVGAPLSDGERLYLQLQDGTIVAVNQEMPSPPLTPDQIADLLPDTGGPLPDNVVWHVDQPMPWPAEVLGLPLGGMAVADGYVYRALLAFDLSQGQEGAGGIEAYDAATGERRWQLPLHFMDGGLTIGNAITAGDGAVYVVENTSPEENGPPTSWDLVAINGKDGSERWRLSFENAVPSTDPTFDPADDQSIDTLAYGDGVIYISNGSAVVTAIDSQTGEQLWQSQAPSVRTRGVSAPTIKEGSITELPQDTTEGSEVSITPIGDRVYVVTSGGSIVALDVANGETLGIATPTSTEHTSKPVVIGDLLVVTNAASAYSDAGFQVGKSGTVTAFNAADYTMAWETELSGSPGNPLAAGDQLFVSVLSAGSSTEGAITKIDPQTGDLLQTGSIDGQSSMSTITIDGSQYIVANSFFDGTISLIDPASGEPIASTPELAALNLIPGDNGLAYGTLFDGTLVAVDLIASGNDQDHQATPEAAIPVATASISD